MEDSCSRPRGRDSLEGARVRAPLPPWLRASYRPRPQLPPLAPPPQWPREGESPASPLRWRLQPPQQQ